MQVTDWSKADYGKFFNGDSYIILNTYKKEEVTTEKAKHTNIQSVLINSEQVNKKQRSGVKGPRMDPSIYWNKYCPNRAELQHNKILQGGRGEAHSLRKAHVKNWKSAG